MKRLILLGFILMIATNLSAQFRTFSFQKSEVPELKIVQIDFREFSTLIHFQYTNIESAGWACIDENIYVMDKQSFKKYKLLNSINLPICDKKHSFDQTNQQHNFTLEFEKIPEIIDEFDIIENTEGGFNFYGVKIDTTIKTKDFLDVFSFIDETPVKEYSFYYKDGNPVLYYKHNGLMIAVLLTYDNNYGRYYQANILIQNITGREFNFNPENISAEYFKIVKSSKKYKKKKVSKNDDVYFNPKTDINLESITTIINDTLVKYEAKVLTYNEYMRKVKNRQAWSAFAVAFSESMAASNAGYSSSTTQTSVQGYSNSYGSAAGYIGNTSGSVYGRSSTYASAYGTSSTQKYDGAAAYAAQQNANRNISNFQNQQFEIRRNLSEGYMKLNTIMNGNEYVGFVNLVYSKVDKVKLNIPINNTIYTFYW